MRGTTSSGLPAFHALGAAAAERELLTCCASPVWAAEMTRLRPYGDLAGLLAAAQETLVRLDWPQVLQALAAHPRIGAKPRGADREAGWSRTEQSGMNDAEHGVRDAVDEGNLAYERRFGHIYLICATGLTADQLLDALRRRLGNDERTERGVVREELAKIVRLRLIKLLGDP
ncbi:2-oxo-4-hydroxy-4-carboxy-5-ureidoimidazoline decarboxylase [Rhizohabitans arisaemae]|uniref:2-oxo-4-hydroxy-4-carboxy-5-ureidoimidazoline decarboxylase n=1 Tax=Rhizohabitans arisaemae TaxID=2720610 RepID=UPI0024B16826|nr:2-oxo-4-hydroxy-4-carboxy-5-ureidoimidazoline decarboxylase [Rhizohabitans arisaemae]